MIRYFLTATLGVHGLIHTLGFLVAFHLAPLPLTQLTPFWLQSWTRPIGVLWLLAAIGFVASATSLLLNRTYWWIPGVAALLFSQLVIAVAWQDAKAGTWLNALILVPLIMGAAHAAFERSTQRALAELRLGLPETAGAPVRADDLEHLPKPVRHWLTTAGVIGRARPRSVWLSQAAQLRTEPNGAWMPCEAEQHFRIDRPGFIWSVRARMFGVLPIDGRDSYIAGHGRMLIKPLSLLTLVDAADSHVDQGTLLRYLGELVWFPAAALEPYIQWSEVDDTTARATMSQAGIQASATFTFAADGRVLQVSAERYMGSGESARLLPWTIPLRAWSALDGVVIPVQGEVIWQLPSGPFKYYEFTLRALRYDRQLVPIQHAGTSAGATADTAI